MRTVLVLVLLAFVVGVRPAPAQNPIPSAATPSVSWDFDIKSDQYENPHGSVYLRVGKKRHFITKTGSRFRTLPRADYKQYKVPADALIACSGWWAGQGEDLYVVRHGKQLDVYLRGLDEQTDIPPYKRLKSIPLR